MLICHLPGSWCWLWCCGITEGTFKIWQNVLWEPQIFQSGTMMCRQQKEDPGQRSARPLALACDQPWTNHMQPPGVGSLAYYHTSYPRTIKTMYPCLRYQVLPSKIWLKKSVTTTKCLKIDVKTLSFSKNQHERDKLNHSLVFIFNTQFETHCIGHISPLLISPTCLL